MTAMRLQRALARAGVDSRRHSEDLIGAGRVTVNGRVAKIGESVDPERDEIRVDGKTIRGAAAPVWIMLHKPAGVMTTRADPRGRKTVFRPRGSARVVITTAGLCSMIHTGAAATLIVLPSTRISSRSGSTVSPIFAT